MKTFKVWDPDCAHEDEDLAGSKQEALNAKDAAEAFCEDRHAMDDYPDSREVHVRASDGTLSRWDVVTVQIPSFDAVEMK